MSGSDLPELSEIERIVLECLTEGFYLEKIDLTVDDLDGGRPPAFTVLITISEDAYAEGHGLSHEIGSRIRQKWSRDDLYVKTKYIDRASAADRE